MLITISKKVNFISIYLTGIVQASPASRQDGNQNFSKLIKTRGTTTVDPGT